MKLISVELSTYRSFRTKQELAVDEGLTCIVGPNNSGKSNLLRALELVLATGVDDSGEPVRGEFDRSKDIPQFPSRVLPRVARVSVTFQSTARPEDKQPSQERSLLRRALDYERATNPTLKPLSANAGKGLVEVSATFSVRDQGATVVRHDYLRVPGVAKSPASRNSPFPEPGSKVHDQFFREFHNAVRLVTIRSGEALESVLQGPFREVLEGVIRDHLTHELTTAREARETYTAHLRDTLLAPLADQITQTTGNMFPEVSRADLLPAVPQLQETLSSMGVTLSDAITSDLRSKGTGLRAGVLIAIMRYLADQSRRSLVLAIEEPESFLHPGAQEDLRSALVGLAGARDTTVLITTHSPFMLANSESNEAGRTVGVVKAADGTSSLDTRRDVDHAAALFHDGGVSFLLRTARGVPRTAKLVLITEGVTDIRYFQIAARKAGRQDLIDSVHMLPAGGATKLPALAVLTAAATAKPVVCLVDSDEMGQKAARILEGFHQQPNRVTLKIGGAPGRGMNPVVGEDLWPEGLKARMEAELAPLGTAVLKEGAPQWFERNATEADTDRLVKTLEWIHSRAEKISGSSRPHGPDFTQNVATRGLQSAQEAT